MEGHMRPFYKKKSITFIYQPILIKDYKDANFMTTQSFH